MGQLLKTFTFERNTLKRDALTSAQDAHNHITLAANSNSASKGEKNIIGALRSFTGVLDSDGRVTDVGKTFNSLYHQNPEDAWRWLLTRSLWLYSVPNGTNAKINEVAKAINASFSIFQLIVSVLMHLETRSGDERFLYYEEFAELFDDDAVWSLEPHAIFFEILKIRATKPVPRSTSWLQDLEVKFGIPRDNISAFFAKALKQTGLFDYKISANRTDIGIALRSNMDSVLRERVRFILDNAKKWDGTDWSEYLQIAGMNFPATASLLDEPLMTEVIEEKDVIDLVDQALSDFRRIGLTYERSLVSRFVASLLAKRFVILTGLSGSGKTKLAQAFAAWITPRSSSSKLSVGSRFEADQVEYTVTGVDEIAIELDSPKSGKRVCLPIALAKEWIEVISREGYTRDTPAETILLALTHSTKYSTQLNSFDAELKALSFALLEAEGLRSSIRHFEVVPVGPDWNGRESCFGYLDALREDKFVRSTPIIGLILSAQENPSQPFFLILDEMNLSHVERYFADFLSAAESGESMYIHGNVSEVDGVPPTVPWPKNLYVVGTVNVDETTYTFSPKVLDRANTIEFRVEHSQMSDFLALENKAVSIAEVGSMGAQFAVSFNRIASLSLPEMEEAAELKVELGLLFEILSDSGLEFGFRTANEMSRFLRRIN